MSENERTTKQPLKPPHLRLVAKGDGRRWGAHHVIVATRAALEAYRREVLSSIDATLERLDDVQRYVDLGAHSATVEKYLKAVDDERTLTPCVFIDNETGDDEWDNRCRKCAWCKAVAFRDDLHTRVVPIEEALCVVLDDIDPTSRRGFRSRPVTAVEASERAAAIVAQLIGQRSPNTDTMGECSAAMKRALRIARARGAR